MSKFEASVTLSSALERNSALLVSEFTIGAVNELSTKYGFDACEALLHLGIKDLRVESQVKGERTKSKAKGPSIPLPYCGMARDGWCGGIRLSHGLYGQCTMLPKQDGEFCGTCQKQADAHDGVPTYGKIQDRGNLEWSDTKGKKPVNYGNVMLKLNISRAQAEAEAAKFGLTIPEEQFEVQEAKKGRPAKKKDASDTESEGGEPVKKRGRPKKNKKVVSGSAGDDLIATLLANATVAEPVVEANLAAPAVEEKKPSDEEKRIARNEKARQKREEKKALQQAAKIQLAFEVKNEGGGVAKEEKTNLPAETLAEIDEVFDGVELKVSPTSLSGCSDATPEVKVIKFEFEGKTYLKDDDDCLFDMESQEHVGNWNGKSIDYCDEDE